MVAWPPAGITVVPEDMILGSLSKYVMQPQYVLTIIFTYVILVHVLQPPKEKSTVSRIEAKKSTKDIGKVAKQNSALTAFIFLHNTFLCLYSAWTFVKSAPLVYKVFTTEGVCDPNNVSWNSGMLEITYLFYLSKYYEFVDTAIILMKGRRVITLQTYHHAGAILGMYLGCLFIPTQIYSFVVFNSFVHTIMYAYYALTSIGFTPPGKKYITKMQLTQFFLGFGVATVMSFFEHCNQFTKVLATSVNLLYVIPLVSLFLDFSKKTYKKKAE
ncbi:putative elongation of fatty acids protein [Zancudomyces culisetae]|uniref:Elongation of fatty acids protein n=1 Tax=Zancudomyces culisetae TaxID=1213189 RepID=A0A1R1PYR9_ZANCU|nr:putative elongation of fatty acids protein [Zancudomyces culisetae]|eukprot:OMH86103.1 putative elongation of fatty acids protein [Zancudomyces culisetae]